MSTRSIIGIANDAGFEGRYAHWDGYPSGRVPLLLQTYQEVKAGTDQPWLAVIAWAVRPGAGENGYWSSYATPSQVATNEAMPDTVSCTYDAPGRPGFRDDEHVTGPCNVCNTQYRTSLGQMPNPAKRVTWQAENGEGWNTHRDDVGQEFVYLLDERGITVLTSGMTGWFGSLGLDEGEHPDYARLALVPWDTDPDDPRIELLNHDQAVTFA